MTTFKGVRGWRALKRVHKEEPRRKNCQRWVTGSTRLPRGTNAEVERVRVDEDRSIRVEGCVSVESKCESTILGEL